MKQPLQRYIVDFIRPDNYAGPFNMCIQAFLQMRVNEEYFSNAYTLPGVNGGSRIDFRDEGTFTLFMCMFSRGLIIEGYHIDFDLHARKVEEHEIV